MCSAAAFINLKNSGRKAVFYMKKFLNDFKAFACKGNIVDMAVGVVVGTAFSKIVNALVANIIMPLVSILIGKTSFSSLSVTINNAIIPYGVFIQSVVEFLIIAFSIFVVISVMNKIFKRKEAEKPQEAPKKSDEVLLLEEIRDLMKK